MMNRDYFKSKRTTKVKKIATEDAKILAAKLLATLEEKKREFYSDAIVNDMCDAVGIPHCNVVIKDQNQYHRKNEKGNLRTKTLGYYLPKSNTIVIYNKTAIRQKPVAGKTFLRTLVHEFMHHYDRYKLKIRSLHTSGFYERVNGVLEQLI